MTTLRDLDGSILGGKGYIVANNTNVLPPAFFSPAPPWLGPTPMGAAARATELFRYCATVLLSCNT